MGSRAFLVTAVVAVAVAATGADVAADRAECSDKLVALATCLTFVQGQGQAPTPDCCGGLKTVLQTSPKCLCVLVKDRDDPGLDLKLNVTRALGLPAACGAPSNISDCPRLLNLPPNSKDAQVFEEFAKQQAAQSSPTGGASSAASTGAQKNAAARVRWLGVGGVGVAARAAPLVFFAVPFLLLLR